MSLGKEIKRIERKYRNTVRDWRLKAMFPKQETLAKRTGINRSILSAIENNKVFLSSRHALLIKEALGCTLDDLYEKV